MGSGPLHTSLELIQLSADFLAEKGVPSPRLDAELLLAHVLGCTRLSLYTDHGRPIVPAELDRYRELIRARGRRVPLQLLVGEAHLLDRSFTVRQGVFLPRPETETLVLRCQELDFAGGFPSRIVEVGTGTGCIGILLLLHWTRATLVGFDRNARAVELSRENAARHGVAERADLREGDPLGEALPTCDLLVSNPPYIPTADLEGLDPEVRDHDPVEALDGGSDGLDVLRRLAERGREALAGGGWLAFEHGYDQGERAPALLREAGYEAVVCHVDLAGRPRVTLGRRPAV